MRSLTEPLRIMLALVSAPANILLRISNRMLHPFRRTYRQVEHTWIPTRSRRKRLAARLTVSVIIAGIVASGLAPLAVQGIEQGDGKVVYGEGSVTTPRVRDFTAGAFAAEASAATAAATIRHTIVKAAPNRNEMISGVQTTTGGVLYIQRWNGSSWSAEWNVTVGDSDLPRFDIAYEQSSGKAMVVYSANAATTNELRYRTYNGTTWSAEQNLDTIQTAAIVGALKLEARGGTDEIGLVWGDNAMDLSANFWNGATGTWTGEPAAVLETTIASTGASATPNTWSFDLAFESISGKLMVAWGSGTTLTGPKWVMRTAGSGGTWGSVNTNSGFFEQADDISISADPLSNYIAYVNNSADSGNDADAGIWDGSAWGSKVNFDTSLNATGAGTTSSAINWLSSGTQSRAILTYDDFNSAGVEYKVFNKNTATWAANASYTTAPAPVKNDDKLHRLRKNPFNGSELMLLVVDDAFDLFAKKITFDGTNVTFTGVEGGAALETSVSSVTGLAADYAYSKFIPARTYEQSSYRWFSNLNSTSVGSALAALNTAPVAPARGSPFRLRLNMHVAGNDLVVSGQQFKLQYAGKGAGSCTSPLGTPNAYTDVNGSTNIKFYDNSVPADGAAMALDAADPTHGSDTIQRQTYEEANDFTNSVAAVSPGQDAMWDFALTVGNSAPFDTTYCLRVVKADGSVDGSTLNSYTAYPEIITAPQGPDVGDVMRHGNFFSGGSEQSLFWADLGL